MTLEFIIFYDIIDIISHILKKKVCEKSLESTDFHRLKDDNFIGPEI